MREIDNQISKMLEEVMAGLKSQPKTLPAKYFYDDKGIQLFNRICSLNEYYITNTEIEILRTHINAIVQALGERPAIFEFGSGASTKTEIILSRINDISYYVPIDISAEYLDSSVMRLEKKYPRLKIIPLLKDFSAKLDPAPTIDLSNHRNNVGFFPGSTIGNFSNDDALKFLRNVASFLGAGCKLLIGVDAIKDVSIVKKAYNDSLGITREFNLNILHRLNRELYTNFDLNRFEHQAIYNEYLNRIEMHLVCTKSCSILLGKETILFSQGERIHTEYSYKYAADDFIALANNAGFKLINYWTDEKGYFNVFLFILSS